MQCPDCDSVDRRLFLKTAALGTAGAAIAAAVPKKFTGSSETLVTTLYNSLSPEQKPKLVFPFDHPLRSKVDNNWHIVPQKIGQFFTPEQQAMTEEIFRGLHNPDFVEKVLAHMKEDTKGVGLADYQAKRANEVFQALSGKQREQALVGDPRPEKATETIALKKKSELVGLPVGDMTRDQKHLVEKVLADLLMPFRKKDTDEAMRYIKEAGGVGSLYMSFYKNLDIGSDGVWDVWQLESPNMVWYFRGAPHVHTWVNIRAKA